MSNTKSNNNRRNKTRILVLGLTSAAIAAAILVAVAATNVWSSSVISSRTSSNAGVTGSTTALAEGEHAVPGFMRTINNTNCTMKLGGPAIC
jgi:hypothetical protein